MESKNKADALQGLICCMAQKMTLQNYLFSFPAPQLQLEGALQSYCPHSACNTETLPSPRAGIKSVPFSTRRELSSYYESWHERTFLSKEGNYSTFLQKQPSSNVTGACSGPTSLARVCERKHGNSEVLCDAGSALCKSLQNTRCYVERPVRCTGRRASYGPEQQ